MSRNCNTAEVLGGQPIIDITNNPNNLANNKDLSASNNKTTVQMWKCDVCKVANFEDYDEACRHETLCALQQQEQQQKQHQKRQEEILKLQKVEDKPPKRKNPPPVATHAFFAPRGSVKRSKQDQKSEDKKSGNRRGEDDTQNNRPSAKITSTTAPTSSATQTKASTKEVVDLTTRTKKQSRNIVDLTQASITAKPGLKRKAAASTTKTTTSSAPLCTSSRKRVDRANKKAPGSPELPSISAETAAALADLIDLEVQETAPNTKKKNLASIFDLGSKKLLAEQRQVEFQAQLRLKKKQELERQQKRAARQQEQQHQTEPVKSLDSVATSSTSVMAKPPKASISVLAADKKLPARPAPSMFLLPLAPRFPVPSHVVPAEQSSFKTESSSELSQRWISLSAIQKSRHNAKSPPEVTALDGEDQTSVPLLPQGQNEQARTFDDSRDFLLETFLNVFSTSTTSPNEENDDSRLWVDKYSGGADFLGQKNQQATQRMKAWVDEWRKTRHRAMDRMADRQRKLQGKRKPRLKQAKKRSKEYDDDDIWDDSDNEDSTLCNLCLVTGPSGSGKSSFVHAVAQQSQCPVLEINTTEARGSAALKNAIQEATQSCSSLDMLNQQKKQQATSQASIFHRVTRPLEDSDDDDDEQEENDKETKKHASLTVILIDEVDAIYEGAGDAGFWSALAAVAKTAKCPIFLTANSIPPMLRQSSSIRYNHIETVRPSPMECVPKILQIIKQDQGRIQIRSEWGGISTHDRLALIAEICNCDIRRIVHELQLFAASNSFLKRSTKNCKTEVKTLGASHDESCSLVLGQPRIKSVSPASIPAGKFSVITITGENLLSLLARPVGSFSSTERSAGIKENTLEIQVGDQTCPKVRIVDDKTILALCPPCIIPTSVDPVTCYFRNSNRKKSLSTQVASVSIRPCGKLGCVDVLDKTVDSIELCNGKRLSASRQTLVSYNFQGGEDSEHEFEEKSLSETTRNGGDISEGLLTDGLAVWKDSLPESSDSSSLTSTVDHASWKRHDCDRHMLDVLEALSKETHWASDAVHLEELQEGIPSLSGACQGFGYDLTQETSSSGGEMRLHDKAPPPRSERLYDLGWNDACYFFGDPETYVTAPNSGRERKLLRTTMTSLRGSSTQATFTQSEKDEGIDPEDFDTNFMGDRLLGSDEDMFLPQHISASIQSIPSLLRGGCGRNSQWESDLARIELLEQKKTKHLMDAAKLVSYVIPEKLQPKASCRGFGSTAIESLLLEDTIDHRLVLDFLPTLRRMAVLESAAEEAYKKNDQPVVTGRRTTRRSAKATRRHYFDRVSPHLHNDMDELETSQVGAFLADGLLVYS